MALVIPTQQELEGETIPDERSEVVSFGYIYDLVILDSGGTGTSES